MRKKSKSIGAVVFELRARTDRQTHPNTLPSHSCPAARVPRNALPSHPCPAARVPRNALPSHPCPAARVPRNALPSHPCPAARVPRNALPLHPCPAARVPRNDNYGSGRSCTTNNDCSDSAYVASNHQKDGTCLKVTYHDFLAFELQHDARPSDLLTCSPEMKSTLRANPVKRNESKIQLIHRNI